MSWAGPLGAAIGFGLGLLEYRLMSAVVIGALRRTDRSTTEAEKRITNAASERCGRR